MASRGLVDYFKKNLAKGYTAESLKIALRRQNYSSLIIDKALEQAHKEIAETAPVLKEKPTIKHEIYIGDKQLVFGKKKSWWRKFVEWWE